MTKRKSNNLSWFEFFLRASTLLWTAGLLWFLLLIIQFQSPLLRGLLACLDFYSSLFNSSLYQIYSHLSSNVFLSLYVILFYFFYFLIISISLQLMLAIASSLSLFVDFSLCLFPLSLVALPNTLSNSPTSSSKTHEFSNQTPSWCQLARFKQGNVYSMDFTSFMSETKLKASPHCFGLLVILATHHLSFCSSIFLKYFSISFETLKLEMHFVMLGWWLAKEDWKR